MTQQEEHWIIVETYRSPPKSGHRGGIRARPISGQAFPITWNVECSRKERERHPVGTYLRMKVRQTSREGGKPYLIANSQGPYEVVPRD